MNRPESELFEILKEACAKQFGFASDRVLNDLQYMGIMPGDRHGFRDMRSHLEIHLSLDPSDVILFGLPGQSEPGWPEDMRKAYCKTDDQLEADHVAWEANIRLSLQSPLWATYGAYIRSLIPEHPTYVPRGLEPQLGAYNLITELVDQADPDVQTFSERMGTTDVQELSFYLLEVYEREIEIELWEAVKSHPNTKKIVRAVEVSLQDYTKPGSQARRLASQIAETLPTHLKRPGSESQIITLTMSNQSSL